MLHIIIPSRNRACQLDATLRSIAQHIKVPHTVSVLYTHDPEFLRGYQELMWNTPYITANFPQDRGMYLQHPQNVNFYKEEGSFKDCFLELINAIHAPYTMFLTDDTIFRRDLEHDEVWKRFERDGTILTLSVRIGLDVIYSRNEPGTVIKSQMPKFEENGPEGNIWNWTNQKAHNWHCPFAFSAHIYRTEDLKKFVPTVDFKGTNHLEHRGGQQVRQLHRPRMICHDKNKSIVFQLNCVQRHQHNETGNLSVTLLEMFWSQDGQRMRMESLIHARADTTYFLCYNVMFESRDIRGEA